MKSLKIWSLLLLIAMAFAGCDNTDANDNGTNNNINNGGNNGGGDVVVQTDIYGKWHLASMSGYAPEFDVYIEFTEGGEFTIYQQVWLFTYECYKGTFTITAGNVVSGVYTDGSEWTSTYYYAVADSKLTLTNIFDSDELCVYDACVIPQEIIDEATSATRSESVVPFL